MTVETVAEPKGLSSVPQLHAILVPAQPGTVDQPRFPGAELVTAAAALYDKPSPWGRADLGAPRLVEADPQLWRTPTGALEVDERFRLHTDRLAAEGRAMLLTVSPGTVGVTVRNRAVLERNSLGALGHETRGTRQVYRPQADEYDGVRYSAEDGDAEFRDPQPTRQVEGWSRRSRARMTRTLAQLDWTPMYADGRSAVMLTLTYPGDWLTVAPTGRQVKRHLERFYSRWQRRWGAPFIGPWKLEFQRRGAPHVHLLTVPPRDPDFRDWLSKAWAACVAHPDPVERAKHISAGTGVDYLKGGRCFDPKRAAVYFSKHGGAAGGKEYQHDVPPEWQHDGDGPGRFWGYKGLARATATVEVQAADYVTIRRTMRRWSRSQGRTRTEMRPRVDTATGVVRMRRTTVRTYLLGYGGLQGGTVLVNDGPAFAATLSRLVVSAAKT